MNYIRLVFLFLSLIAFVDANAQKDSATSLSTPKVSQDTAEGLGVAVSPSHMNFNLSPGQTKTQILRVTNDTKKPKKFKVSFVDFEYEGNQRKQMKPGESKNSLSNWIVASPTFFEIPPGQQQKVNITVKVPDNDSAIKSMWTIIMVDQAEERKALDWAGDKNDKKIAFGVIPTFSFGVYVYQNPPNVEINKVTINQFKLEEGKTPENKTKRTLFIEAKNIGDGIAQCAMYVDLTNTSTGKQQKLLMKNFTIYPNGTRTHDYVLPLTLENGKYTAVAIIDFGSKEEIEAAELEFEVK